MPGQMGRERVSVQKLKVVKIDTVRNVIWVHGGVPGPNGSFVRIIDAVKGAKFPSPPPTPTFVPDGKTEYPPYIEAPVTDDPFKPPPIELAID